VDSDGRLSTEGQDNGIQNLNFGTMAVMITYLQSTRYLSDGSIVINGYPGDNGSVFDPSMWGYSSYTTIRTDTGLSQFFVSESPLPSDYSQTTWTPITTWDYEQQQETEGAKFMLTGVAMLATGTEEFAPEIFGTEATVGEGTVIAEGTAGGNLLTQGSLITDSSRLLPGVSGSPSDIVVLGRQVDTAVAANWPGYQTLNIQNWTIPQNDAFIQAAINQRQTFYLASPVNYQTLWNPNFNGMTVFGRELGQIYQAGYQQVGLLLVPPPLP
jgi:hypothetical protein